MGILRKRRDSSWFLVTIYWNKVEKSSHISVGLEEYKTNLPPTSGRKARQTLEENMKSERMSVFTLYNKKGEDIYTFFQSNAGEL